MQDNQVKNDNLLVLQKALEQELLNEVVTKLDLYEIISRTALSNFASIPDVLVPTIVVFSLEKVSSNDAILYSLFYFLTLNSLD